MSESFDDVLRNLEAPVHITLVWDDQTDEWELTSNAADAKEVIAALSHTLFQLATGDLVYDAD